MVVKINIEKETAKYQAELIGFESQLQMIEAQRAELIRAINERKGILAYLASLNKDKEA